jgi:phospholipid transport system substrate-binding protein
MISRRKLLIAIGLAAVPLGAAAQADDPALAPVKAFYDSLQSVILKTPDPKQRTAALSDAVMRSFDIAAMARLAIGPQWSKIPADKQASLQNAFGRYFVATYGSQLGKAAGGRFEVLPNTDQRTGGRLVHTKLTDAEGKTTPIDYLVNQDGKIIDIYLGGTVSLIAARRSEFDTSLKSGGPDALEAYLKKRADEVGGGT